jgi:hypothetical protein
MGRVSTQGLMIALPGSSGYILGRGIGQYGIDATNRWAGGSLVGSHPSVVSMVRGCVGVMVWMWLL